ncbi:hypothetical protein D9M71_394380 [compost metagenome]
MVANRVLFKIDQHQGRLAGVPYRQDCCMGLGGVGQRLAVTGENTTVKVKADAIPGQRRLDSNDRFATGNSLQPACSFWQLATLEQFGAEEDGAVKWHRRQAAAEFFGQDAQFQCSQAQASVLLWNCDC